MGTELETQIHDAFQVAMSVFIDNGGDMTKPHRIVLEIFETDNKKRESELASGMAQFEVQPKKT